MTRASRIACESIALVGALLLAFQTAQAAPPVTASRDPVAAWLECDECSDAELAAVVDLGPAVVPTLVTILREGMPSATRKELERQLTKRWAERAAYTAKTQAAELSFSREAYVAHHLGNRDSLYRVRAALALGRIATPEAEKALRTALVAPQRPSVEQAIQQALAPPAARP